MPDGQSPVEQKPDYTEALFQEFRRAQAQQAQFNQQVAQALNQQAAAPKPPDLSNIQGLNEQMAQRYLTDGLRVAAEIKQAAVEDAKRELLPAVQREIEAVRLEGDMRRIEGMFLGDPANADLVDYQTDLAYFIGQTPQDLPYHEKLAQAAAATRLLNQGRFRKLSEAQERNREATQAMQARQAVPSGGGQGSLVGPGQEPALSEEEYHRQAFALLKGGNAAKQTNPYRRKAS